MKRKEAIKYLEANLKKKKGKKQKKKAVFTEGILKLLKRSTADKELEAKYKKLEEKYNRLKKAHKALKAELATKEIPRNDEPARTPVTSQAVPAPIFASPKPKTSEEIVLKRIQSKATQINYDRIGHAPGDQADDLTQIKGIGPLLEKRLNALGIYTLVQISRMSPKDEEEVNEAIEYFQGRVSRDEWVEQALKILAKGEAS